MSVAMISAVRPLRMPSSPKAVLVALADYADDSGLAWPSIPKICEFTCLCERSVHAAVKWLEQSGLIKCDRTDGRHTRYSITPAPTAGDAHYVYKTVHPESGRFYIGSRTCSGAPETDSYMGSGSGLKGLDIAQCIKEIVSTHEDRAAANLAETALIESVIGDPLCLNRKVTNPENAGGHPRSKCAPQQVRPASGATTPAAGAVPPPQQVQSPPQQMRSNHQEPPVNHQRTTKPPAAEVVDLPDWLPRVEWRAYVEMRSRIRKPLTAHAVKLAIGKLDELRMAGDDPKAVLNNSVLGSWQGLFAIRKQNAGPSRLATPVAGTDYGSM